MFEPYAHWSRDHSVPYLGALWSSTALQGELSRVPIFESGRGLSDESVELQLLGYVLQQLEQGNLDHLWVIDRPLADCLSHRNNVHHVPAPQESLPDRNYIPSNLEQLDVSLIGVGAPRKNFSTALMAVNHLHETGENVHLHINVVPDDIRLLLDQLSIPWTEHGWLPEDQYERHLTETVDLGIQCFVAESHSYITADFLGRGIPVLASPKLARNFQFEKHGLEHLVVADVDDPHEISSRVRSLWNKGELTSEKLYQRCRQAVEDVAKDHNRMLLKKWKKVENGDHERATSKKLDLSFFREASRRWSDPSILTRLWHELTGQ
jgi:hypothetical protein